MEGFRIDLKTWAKLRLKSTPKVSKSKYKAGFGVTIFRPKSPNLHDPYIIPYYMIILYYTTVTLGRTKYQTFQLQLSLQLLVVLAPYFLQ